MNVFVEKYLAIIEWSWVGYEETDQGGCYPQRPKVEVDNALRDLQNSSYPTKAELNNCFIIHSKYFLPLKVIFALRLALKQRHKGTRKWPITLFVFPLTKYNTTSSRGFLGQRFNNLQRTALLTSFLRHRFNNFWRAALLTSLIQYGYNTKTSLTKLTYNTTSLLHKVREKKKKKNRLQICVARFIIN